MLLLMLDGDFFWFASRTKNVMFVLFDRNRWLIFFQLARHTSGLDSSLCLDSRRVCSYLWYRSSHLVRNALPVWWAYLGLRCSQAKFLLAVSLLIIRLLIRMCGGRSWPLRLSLAAHEVVVCFMVYLERVLGGRNIVWVAFAFVPRGSRGSCLEGRCPWLAFNGMPVCVSLRRMYEGDLL